MCTRRLLVGLSAGYGYGKWETSRALVEAISTLIAFDASLSRMMETRRAAAAPTPARRVRTPCTTATIFTRRSENLSYSVAQLAAYNRSGAFVNPTSSITHESRTF